MVIVHTFFNQYYIYFLKMSYVFISDLLKTGLFFDCVLVIVSLVTLKGSLSPVAILDVKVIESAVKEGHAFFSFGNFFMKMNQGH